MDEFSDCNDLKETSKYKHERTVIHIDLDCFYAQVEMLKNPELSNKPVGIKQQHYVITSNYIAREYGIKKCITITEALALCPKLVIINGEDLHDYRIMSSKVADVIKQFSKNVEKLGLDENFVDVSELVSAKLNEQNCNATKTVVGHIYMNRIEEICRCGCRERLAVGSIIASEIRAKIKEELGMTCCAGIAHNKLLAKLAGPTHKPNQQTTVFPCAAINLISSLTCVRAIPGVGRKTSDVLEAIGISSIQDAQNSSIGVLEKHLGKTLACWIKGACFGVDDTDVKETGRQQVIGLEEAFKKVSSIDEVHERLNSLIERGMVLLEEDGRYPTTIRVSVRKYCPENYERHRETKQCAINPSLFRTSTAKEQLLDIAMNLFKKLVDFQKPFYLTLIGLAFTKFQEEVPPRSSLLQFFKAKSYTTKSLSEFPLAVSKNEEHMDENSGEIDQSRLLTTETSESNTSLLEIDESVLAELPEDLRTEILQTYHKHPDLSGASFSKSSHKSIECPSGIDEKVFKELPHEIQMEIIKDSGNSGLSKARTPNSRKSKKQNSILNYLKK